MGERNPEEAYNVIPGRTDICGGMDSDSRIASLLKQRLEERLAIV
jgi:hypothetical protein